MRLTFDTSPVPALCRLAVAMAPYGRALSPVQADMTIVAAAAVWLWRLVTRH